VIVFQLLRKLKKGNKSTKYYSIKWDSTLFTIKNHWILVLKIEKNKIAFFSENIRIQPSQYRQLYCFETYTYKQ